MVGGDWGGRGGYGGGGGLKQGFYVYYAENIDLVFWTKTFIYLRSLFFSLVVKRIFYKLPSELSSTL